MLKKKEKNSIKFYELVSSCGMGYSAWQGNSSLLLLGFRELTLNHMLSISKGDSI